MNSEQRTVIDLGYAAQVLAISLDFRDQGVPALAEFDVRGEVLRPCLRERIN